MAIAPLLPGTSLLPDTTVDGGYRFRVQAVLGAGGFGITYHAIDLQLAARVVVKELVISEICTRESVAAQVEPLPRCDTEFRYWKDRFFDEARRANQIRHPHVVRVIAVWRERGTVYYAMEEVRGARSLPCSTHAGWRQPEWTLARARSLALLQALAAVHATALIHGDIKPSNVLLDHDDQLVLIDFGTARRMGELNNTATTTMCTPGYAPPELMIDSRVREAGPWSDLYSWAMLTIGTMIYHPTSDQQPLSALTRLQLLQYGGQDPYASLAQYLLNAGVSEGWTTVLLSCISLNPADRLQTVSSVLDVLGTEGLAPDTLPASIRQAQMTSSATVPLPQIDSSAPGQTDASQRVTPRPPRTDPAAFTHTVAVNTSPDEQQDQNGSPGVHTTAPTAPSTNHRGRNLLLAAVLVTALFAIAGVLAWPSLSTLLVRDPTALSETGTATNTAFSSSGSGAATVSTLNGSAEGSADTGTSLATRVPAGFVRVPPGTFAMGSQPQETGRKSNETLRTVTLTRPLAVQVNEVTHEQWRDLMGTSPWFFTRCGPDCPVERVNWYDAVAWANALSISEGLTPCYTLGECTGQLGSGLTTPLDSNSAAPGDYRCANVTFAGLDCSGYRLPTEAEWEYIARAGTTGPWWGATALTPANTACDANAPIRTAAWYECNANTDYFSPIRVGSGDSSTRVGPHTVGALAKNPLNISDILGNVAEWTHDGADQPNTDDSTDPIGQGGSRTVRGGHFRSPAMELRAAARNLVAPDIRSPDIGFRVVRTLPHP